MEADGRDTSPSLEFLAFKANKPRREVHYVSLEHTLRRNTSGGMPGMYKIKRQQGPRHVTVEVLSLSVLERHILVQMVLWPRFWCWCLVICLSFAPPTPLSLHLSIRLTGTGMLLSIAL